MENEQDCLNQLNNRLFNLKILFLDYLNGLRHYLFKYHDTIRHLEDHASC
jgi:hypothetical protein